MDNTARGHFGTSERSQAVRGLRTAPAALAAAILIAICVSAPRAASGAAAQQNQNGAKFLFIAPMFNIQGAGISIDAIRQIGENMIGMLKKRVGVDVEYEMVGSAEMGQEEALDLAMERLKTGGDMSWMDYPHYLKALKAGLPIGIVAMMQIGDSPLYKNCLYALKNSPYKTAADLRGKRTAGGPSLDWASMRSLLYANKIDERPDRFFDDLVPMSTFFASMNGVLLKRLDAVLLSEPIFNLFRKNNPNYDKLAPVVCAEGSPNTFIPVYRKTVDPKILAALRSLIFNADTDKDMGAVRPFLEAANIKFVEPDEASLKRIDRLYREAEERGWFKEEKQYKADFVKIAAQKSLRKCKENCAGSTPEAIKACAAKCDSKFKQK
jgi:ABC-type phosphate/phosphonate transport system substrate-binding protein